MSCPLGLLTNPQVATLHDLVWYHTLGYNLFELFFFFFQAEDGIRDWSVTGVQTCALPIFSPGDDKVCVGGRLIGAGDLFYEPITLSRQEKAGRGFSHLAPHDLATLPAKTL